MYTQKRKYYFLTIAKEKNITRAAELLHVSQPSLSQYITKLEQELDIKLLDRSVTPLQLTRAGEIYADYLHAALNSEIKLMKDLELEKKHQIGPLTVGLPIQASQIILNSIFPAYLNEYGLSDTHISFQEGTTLTITSKVLNNEIDIAFVHIYESPHAELHVEPLQKQRLYLICNKSHTIFSCENYNLRDGLQQSLIYITSKEHLLYQITVDFLSHYGINNCLSVTLSNFNTILDLIANNQRNCVALMPDIILEQYLNTHNSQILIVPVDYNLEWYFALIRRKNKKTTLAGRTFWNFVVKFYKNHNPLET